MSLPSWPALVAAGLLAVVYLKVGAFFPVTGPQRPPWLSLAGGITVAYVFVHILPHIAELQAEWLKHSPDRPLKWLEHQLYVGALVGVLVAYGLDHVTIHDEEQRFWVRLASSAMYNVLIGYYLADVRRPAGLALATVGLGAHFLVNGRILAREGGQLYRGAGRIILGLSVVLGTVLGLTVTLPLPVVAVIFAILAGGIILRALDEEVPSEREGRFSWFAVGSVVYAGLILAAMSHNH